MLDSTTVERARRALEAHAWQDAYEILASADREDLTGESLERLGEAAWWSAHPDESLEAFERAHAAYVAEGEPRRAAFVALRLVFEYDDRMELARSNGWLRRARRLLADQPDCVEQGYLELALVRTSFERGAFDEAMQHAAAVHAIGSRFEDPNLLAFSRAIEGSALVVQRKVEEGLALVDEATLAVAGGELNPFAAGSIYCLTLGICRSVADYRRAAEWTEAVARWCDREAITGFPGVCRVQRAEILRMRGALADAEEEARRAVDELTAFGRLPQAGAGAYEIGEVRLRLGDLEGAEAAFERAHEMGRDPQPGLALLQLAQGRVTAARASVLTALADSEDAGDRARLLAARVEIALAAHDVADARAAADALDELASSFDMPMLHAEAHQARGAVLVDEDAAAAIVELRRAIRLWTDVEAPFEAARARRTLALASLVAGDEAAAEMELRAARAAFDRLGARLEAERCAELMREGAREAGGRRVRRTFMFTDIVGSTELIGTIGDDAWKDVLRWHDETLRTLIASHRGDVVHTTGDGFFASFPDAASAASCAAAIQRRLAEHRRRHGFAPQVRIGLHAAEATVTADDYVGIGVHQAARVAAIAEGGEILVTVGTVSDSAFPFPTSGEREVSLKGLAEPVRIVSIAWREDADHRPSPRGGTDG
jgi:class 3 adenylate cyclase